MSVALCERVVAKALRAGAEQAEAYWSHGRQLDVEIEGGAVSCTSATRSAGGAVRVLRDDRLGFAYFTSEEGAAKAVEAALQSGVPAGGYRLPEGGRAADLPGRFDSRVADAGVEDALSLASDLVAGASEGCPEAHVVGGGASCGEGTEAFASSEGVAVEDRATELTLGVSLVLDDGGAVAHADHVTRHAMDVDAHTFSAGAARTVDALRAPAPPDVSGATDVVLWPEAALSLCGDLVAQAADGHDALRGKTTWSDRLGDEVANSRLSIDDDPLLKGAVGVSPCDGEGLPARTLPIVARGRLERYVFDSWHGHEHGRPSTHSAVRDSFKVRPATGLQHLLLRHEDTRTLDGLVAAVDDGVLVADVLGAHTANATTGEFSVTATNVWRIRNGAVAGPCGGVAIAGSLDRLLRGAEAAGEAKTFSGARVPSLLVRGLDVSS